MNRYTPVTQAEYVLPPSSRESVGKNLKSFRVPALQSFISNNPSNVQKEESQDDEEEEEDD